MSSESGKRTKFRSPHLLTDEQIRERGIADGELMEYYRRYQYRLVFAVRSWYHLIPEHTFRTQFVGIPLAACRAIRAAFRRYKGWDARPDENADPEADDAELERFLREDVTQALANEPNGMFLKLNMRSAKDALWHADPQAPEVSVMRRRLAELVGPRIKRHGDGRATFEGREAVALAWYRCSIEVLRVRAAEDVRLQLCRSQKVHDDLGQLLRFGERAAEDAQLVLREYDDEVPKHPESEFRGFVCENRLTAITQYADSFHFGGALVRRKEELLAQMTQFWEKHVRDALSHLESYVIDFCVIGERVRVVELNPFGSNAGAGLFSWATDRETLLRSTFPVLRVREAGPDRPDDFDVIAEALPHQWVSWTERTFALNG